ANETASGWQTATFATPVAVTANTVYVASYHLNNGHYGFASNYFGSSGVDNGPLHALANGTSANGVYRYTSTSADPNQTYNSANSGVALVYTTSTTDTTPPVVTSVSPAGGSTSVDINANVVATFSEALDASSIGGSTFELRDSANSLVSAAVTYNAATKTAT